MKLATDQVSHREMAIILSELNRVIKDNVDGDVVEMGCYEGGSAVAMQEVLAKFGYPKGLWLYDSFEGLPEKTNEDESSAGESFKSGELKASKARLERNFFKRDLQIPEIKKAWFFELDPEDLPEKIALAFLDGDYYESIMDSLKLVWPKMSSGGVILVDDFDNVALPGVKRAVEEFFSDYEVGYDYRESLAIIRIL
ncbi:class I SAM-dependent methyltransferase [Candidatus Saccharibacteria bacterium]|nr:class I SAM-dependent methyltransferase [Candidatus Saccharibacteria bacterium]